ncbi:hypothetical protein A2331_06575 [Candidatus Falkowbacteria bacterium RIFOXYB2_FULL_34_18]|uniref:RNA polymerase sigma factor n=1 Tax=Candidatus Falkowbacteria bacterium RIFOXYD2_FULL_34_120 TaxID=1798007 RepID=A0A1F5TRP2_9BACT|nr:MAG: hypothetical protein A2331_06575 [Candidatus Falkowbacteria bacterium RIFOXYB2_FULL_34_18]OGF30014.1 MAG: hypothetical protein A2500_04105 [Candidatus Falkowbacteria bacterium RIFOXYC12_FULL_34_55]OGF37129.1 MAG: hypothetical protein A2466_02415 [Candidatus Falkowbacteria bacterium RIFOXYC2_FULL_34_220]OGF39550.1 MAG: hypothetical protein A2515_04470 [Candidatus Falkowbacteria bacterium RIFOXYD12_FULL_34_57]OGF41467.1 MAG: hypothetical protein A2531_02130 [Candidatus Falkowbacteria bact
MSSKINDKTLYFRMKQKDKEAFISAYDSYLNDIYRFIYFKVGNREEAEDLTSSVFLKTWNYIQDNNLKSYKTLKALLYRIARNAVIDHYRQKSKRQDISYDAELGFDVEDEKQDNLQKMEMIDSYQEIEEHMKELKDEYREIIVLKYINELSISEIAEVLDKKKGNVRVLIHRAETALKEIVKKNN